MIVPVIILLLGILFVFGGIKGYSIVGLLTGHENPAAGGEPSGNPAAGTPLDPTAPNSGVTNANVITILNAAQKYLGVPYRFGGNDPATGIDCSRFVQLVYQAVGIQLPRTTYEQFQEGIPVDLSNLQIGDVIFTEPSPAGPGHEGLYVGNNQVQESPHHNDINKIEPLSTFLTGGFVGVRRYL